jgi:hypothetical protein
MMIMWVLCSIYLFRILDIVVKSQIVCQLSIDLPVVDSSETFPCFLLGPIGGPVSRFWQP